MTHRYRAIALGGFCAAFVAVAFAGPAAAQNSNAPVTGYGACRVSIKVTRPFPIAEGVVQKDLERLVRDWNMNSKVPSMDGRCAVGTLAEIQEYVDKWSNENGLELVDFKPDWEVITFHRLGSGTNSRPPTQPSKANADASAAKEKSENPAPVLADDRRKKAAEAHAAVEARNRAAQEKYEADLAAQKQKVADYERAKEDVARRKAEQTAAAQRVLDAHQQRMQAHGAALQQYEQAVADQGNRAAPQPGRPGRFQATTGFHPTREAALDWLNTKMRIPGPISDIECSEVTFYSPPKWTCKGFYYQDRAPAAGRAQ
nr:hypothetical protein [uncultured Sphingomonas sp.]